MEATKLAVLLFLILLIAGVAYGLMHDFGSRPRGIVRAIIVQADSAKYPYKAPSPTPLKLTAQLVDGTHVLVRTSHSKLPSLGSDVELTEMVSPWGQIWYQLNQQP
ncbi:MAG: hypothetical protein CTY31_12165 [Hyphomicrobium sp.]|nr:MAG: hypothetical protein CTY31_12165 [Hyphomicrobium sp.]